MLPDKVQSALDAIYMAGYDRSRWESALETFCASIGARAGITVPRVAAEDTIHLPFSADLHEFASRFVAEGWYMRDYRADRGWGLTDQGQNIVLEQDIVVPGEHERLPMQNDLCRHYDLKWWAGITFDTADRTFVLSVFRGESGVMFSEDDRALFGHLAPHLSRAVTIAERLGSSHGRVSFETLEALGEAAIFLDGGGRVIEMTGRAEALMGSGLSVLDRRLVATRPQIQTALTELIARALAEGPQSGAPLRIPRKGKRPLLVDMLPVPGEFDRPLLFARLIVLVIDLDDRPLPARDVLAAIFGLSPREAQLGLDLASGMTLTESAERHGVSSETVRTQLKALFYKTGTHRQSELISLLHTVARRYRSQP
ncbi:helix-turn-helix transcriptional regulator, partial [Pelagibacterium montanilacus]|uniref:helix-turn-helix transcriptional regulator n=1 Tax=Pelagibacterium montanilacus TaxID=2185280 RepID=UPI0013E05ECE